MFFQIILARRRIWAADSRPLTPFMNASNRGIVESYSLRPSPPRSQEEIAPAGIEDTAGGDSTTSDEMQVAVPVAAFEAAGHARRPTLRRNWHPLSWRSRMVHSW
jgi:hypothetical protein